MCGIACFFSEVVTPDGGQEILKGMLGLISHRGPDAAGSYNRNGWFQGHVRLSILDLERGRQPMKSASGNHVISFNGEIFNFRELKSSLESEGVKFATNSDTEVIVEGVERHGINFISRLNGQFAFVIYARRERRIYMARDRFGIRPLFWQRSGRDLIMASEVKAVFCHPNAVREIDPEGLDQAITFWGALPPKSCFAGVRQVLPGEVLIVDLPSLQMKSVKFWSFSDLLNLPRLDLSAGDCQDGLVDVLSQSVRRQMVSDVPVGCYLSGGIDSSVISSLAQKEMPAINLFSVSFEDSQFDESSYQKLLADKLKANHHSINVKYSDIAENFERVVWHAESLLFRTAPVPLFMLSGLVREHGIKVVLTGEGSDEVLWGYDTFKEQKVRMFWQKNPASIMRPKLLLRLFPYLKHYNEQNYEMLKMFYQDSLNYPDDVLYSHSVRFANNRGLKRYLSAEIKSVIDYSNTENILHDFLPSNINSFLPLERNQILEFMTLLQGYLLSSQGDRMAMSHSVEGRFPFLDNEVVDYCFTLPARNKMNGLTEKYILKRAFAKQLPDEIVNRSKQAYMAPDLKSFFSSGALEQTTSLLNSTNIQEAGIWDSRAVEKLVNKFSKSIPSQVSFRDNMAICAIISSQHLYSLFIKNYPPKWAESQLSLVHEEHDND